MYDVGAFEVQPRANTGAGRCLHGLPCTRTAIRDHATNRLLGTTVNEKSTDKATE